MVRHLSVRIAYLATVISSSFALCLPSHAKTELLVFSSPHCGPCQQLKPTVAELAKQGYPIRPVDVTQHPALATKFRVSRVPALVMVSDGREVARQLGGDRGSIQRMFAAAGLHSPPPVGGPNPSWTQETPHAPAIPARQVSEASHNVPSAPSVPAEFATRLLETSVRITINDATGKSHGTGTIVDTREGDALVVTCGHLFRGESAKGEITIERFRVTGGGLEVLDRARGHLESYDLDRDVGLVSFRPNGEVAVAPVAAQFGEQINDRVWSVGCDLGAKPTVRDSRVTDIDRYHGPPNVETSGAPIQGRSGGGLFNAEGELIGVCFAADEAGDEGLYSGLASVHAQLDALGLHAIYRPSATTATASNDKSERFAPLPTGGSPEPVVRGQEPPASVATPGAFPQRPTPLVPHSLPAVERAGLEEIARRATEAEVVVIIRPLEPGGNSEVIKLDRVSPQFLQALQSMAP